MPSSCVGIIRIVALRLSRISSVSDSYTFRMDQLPIVIDRIEGTHLEIFATYGTWLNFDDIAHVSLPSTIENIYCRDVTTAGKALNICLFITINAFFQKHGDQLLRLRFAQVWE